MTYIVTTLGPVTHDGVTYTEGQEVPGLSEDQAAALVASGAGVEQKEPAKPGKHSRSDD